MNAKEPKSAGAETPWHKSSFLFIIIFFISINGYGLIALIALVMALLNLRHDNWYRFLWPWIFVLMFSAAGLVGFATRIIAENYIYEASER